MGGADPVKTTDLLKVLRTSGESPMRLLGATRLCEMMSVQVEGSVWTAVSKLHTITLSLDMTWRERERE